MNILITGGLGFIGSNLIKRIEMPIVLDTTPRYNEIKNIKIENNLLYTDFHFYDYKELKKVLLRNEIDFVVHLGAITDTTCTDENMLFKYNTFYSQCLWNECVNLGIPLIYASSAATYGDSENFSDKIHPKKLKPLNLYAKSKNDFDKFVFKNKEKPPFWAGLKFFNVYGFGESHKGKMSSMAYQIYQSLKTENSVRLFRDGKQSRDFVFVEDVCDVIVWMIQNYKNIESGLYNVGTGEDNTFLDLAENVYCWINDDEILHIEEDERGIKVEDSLIFDWIDMPKTIVNKYQNHTKADISKLREQGYTKKFTPINLGIKSYVQKLMKC